MKQLFKYISFLLFFVVIVFYEITWLGVYQGKYNISSKTLSSAEFRDMNFGETGLNQIRAFAEKYDYKLENCVSVIMIVNDYDLSKFKIEDYTRREYLSAYKELKKIEEFSSVRSAYKKVIKDLTYFPVPEKNGEKLFNYVNSWGAQRTYSGERQHEGTDIMDNQNKRGYLPVLSMTNGVVENMGWLELGGYRIGIRSDSGGYYYYAHLYSYADGLKEGDRVNAGQLIGFMGDTGYSKVEGTTGNFAVHLHVGIYIGLENGEEISVNPYYILKNLETNTIEYQF